MDVGTSVNTPSIDKNEVVYFSTCKAMSPTNRTCISGELLAFSSQGSLLWSTSFDGNSGKSAPPIIVEEKDLIYLTNGTLFVFSRDGALLWKKEMNVATPPIISGNRLFFSDGYRWIVADEQGNTLFESEQLEVGTYLGGDGFDFSVMDQSGNHYVSQYDFLTALSWQGTKLWSFSPGTSRSITSGIIIDNDGVIYFGTENAEVFALEP